MGIRESLFNIQQELKAPKSQHNDFGNFSYRSCEDILEAVKPLLKANNCVLTISDELVNVGERYYIKATATLKSVEDGDNISNSAYAREPAEKKGADLSQITGACSSYARKYALNGLFCIDDVKDSDTTNNGKKDAKATKTQIKRLKELYTDIPAMLDYYKLEKLEDMSREMAEGLIIAKERLNEKGASNDKN
jgi:hypothetical protein